MEGPELLGAPGFFSAQSYRLSLCVFFGLDALTVVLGPIAHAFLRAAPMTSRTESITSSGFSPWMKWPLFVCVMCSASRCVASRS